MTSQDSQRQALFAIWEGETGIDVWREVVRHDPVPDHLHGRANGSRAYGCLCDKCRKYRRDYAADLRARKRQLRESLNR